MWHFRLDSLNDCSREPIPTHALEEVNRFLDVSLAFGARQDCFYLFGILIHTCGFQDETLGAERCSHCHSLTVSLQRIEIIHKLGF